MATVGPIITVPMGSYCNVTLASGARLVVSHYRQERRGPGPTHLIVERLTMIGFNSEILFHIGLETVEGRRVLARLGETQSVTLASPLRALVAHIQDCVSIDQVVAACRHLVRSEKAPDETA